MQIPHRAVVWAVFLLASSCTSTQLDERDNIRGGGFGVSTTELERLAGYNTKTLSEHYGHERRAARRGDPNSVRPGLGIALSGGGMRAASFSMGVLTAMHEQKQLEDVEIMSAVSGGSYAMSWYFLQHFYDHQARPNATAADVAKFEAEMFRRDSRFQRLVGGEGRLLRPDLLPGGLGHYSGAITYGIGSVALAPVHFLSNYVFGGRFNINGVRHIYEEGIRRAFHTVPTSTGDYERTLSLPFFGMFGAQPPTCFTEIGQSIAHRRLPHFIINATANIDDDMHKRGARLVNSIFEFTPLSFGNDGYGYYDLDICPVTVNRAVSISGAAADSTVAASDALRILGNVANLNLGYYVANPHPDSYSPWWGLLPWPFYLFFGHTLDNTGNAIYLSDGGHSENLGAFSLLRRGCQKIVIIDAGRDEDYTFEDFHKFRHHARAELGIEIVMPELDAYLKKHVGDRDKLAQCEPPVFLGEAFLPLAMDGKNEATKIEIVLVKPWIEPAKLATYPEAVRNYYAEDDLFPQQTTLDQNYPRRQYDAYVELGRKIWLDHVKRSR